MTTQTTTPSGSSVDSGRAESTLLSKISPFASPSLWGERESALPDDVATNAAVDEIAARGGDFDLMVVYLLGLDHFLHLRGDMCEAGELCGDRFFRLSLHENINRVVRQMEDLLPGTAFGIFSDHGHLPVLPDAFIDLEFSGSRVVDVTGNVSMKSVLAKDDTWRVGGEPFPADPGGQKVTFNPFTLEPDVPRNVVFVPQFGMAHVYIAANAGTDLDADWRTAPTLELMDGPVKALYKTVRRAWAPGLVEASNCRNSGPRSRRRSYRWIRGDTSSTTRRARIASSAHAA